MRQLVVCVTALVLCGAVRGQDNPSPDDPQYSASSILNGANREADTFAPNSVISIHGSGLTFATVVADMVAVKGSYMPYKLAGAGVTVIVNGRPAALYLASPEEVRFAVSPRIKPGKVRVQLVRDGRPGPEAVITLKTCAPALFQIDPDFVFAAHADGSLVHSESPARPGESITVFATGLGPTVYLPLDREMPKYPIKLARMDELILTLDGVPVPPENLQFAGSEAGYPGVYKIVVTLPETLGKNPVIRAGFDEVMSKEGVLLPAMP